MQSGTIRDFHDGLSGRIGNDAAIFTQTRPWSEYSMRAGLPGRIYERQWGRKGSVMQAQSNIFAAPILRRRERNNRPPIIRESLSSAAVNGIRPLPGHCSADAEMNYHGTAMPSCHCDETCIADGVRKLRGRGIHMREAEHGGESRLLLLHTRQGGSPVGPIRQNVIYSIGLDKSPRQMILTNFVALMTINIAYSICVEYHVFVLRGKIAANRLANRFANRWRAYIQASRIPTVRPKPLLNLHEACSYQRSVPWYCSICHADPLIYVRAAVF